MQARGLRGREEITSERISVRIAHACTVNMRNPRIHHQFGWRLPHGTADERPTPDWRKSCAGGDAHIIRAVHWQPNVLSREKDMLIATTVTKRDGRASKLRDERQRTAIAIGSHEKTQQL